MPTFIQRHVIYEAGYGDVVQEIIISDDYAKLFDDPDAQFVNIFKMDSSLKDIAVDTGIQAEDEMKLQFNELTARTPAELEAIEFLKEAQNPANKRFCAYFLQPDDPRTTASLEFSGVIMAEQSRTDLQWNNQEFGTVINPLGNWKITVKSFDVNVFDDDDALLEDLLFNRDEEGNPTKTPVGDLRTDALTKQSAWTVLLPELDAIGSGNVHDQSRNVADRLAYGITTSERQVRFAELVNLNKVARALADVLQARLREKLGLPDYTIVFDESETDGKFSPARPRIVQSYNGKKIRYCEWLAGRSSRFGGSGDPLDGKFYKLYANDSKFLKLGSTSDADSPWVHWRMFDPTKATRDLSVLGKCKTLADLFYGIASTFGMFVRFYYASTSELHIKFIARKNLKKSPVYIKNAESAELSVSPFKSSSEKKASVGQSCNYALEGRDLYFFKLTNESHVFSDDTQKDLSFESSTRMRNNSAQKSKETGSRLLFTISPTVRHQTVGEDDGSGFLSGFCLMHNSVFYDNNYRKDHHRYSDEMYRATDPDNNHIHTAIYMQTVGIADGDFGYGTAGQNVWLPVGAVSIKDAGGNEISFRATATSDLGYHPAPMTGYVNYLRGLEGSAFKSEYSITVPFLCSFRRSDDGSHDDDDGGRGRWQNLELGSVQIFDGREYMAIGIERFFNLKTKIKFHATSAYAFNESAGLIIPEGEDDGVGIVIPAPDDEFGGTPASPFIREFTALDEIKYGDAFALNDDGLGFRAFARRACHQRVTGICLSNVLPGETFTGQLGLRVACTNWDFTPGSRIFVRTNALPGFNLSENRLTDKTADEDTCICVGIADTPQSIIYDKKMDFVYYPPID